MGKKRASNKAKTTWYDATKCHRAVLTFLDDEDLICAFQRGLKPGVEKAVGLRLTSEMQPVPIDELADAAGKSSARISQVREDINGYFSEFLKESLISAAGIEVKIPASGKSRDTRFGYYLAFYDTNRQRFLTGDEATEVRKRIYYDRIRSLLRDKLRKEASEAFSRKLGGRDDYQPLTVEIGIFKDEQTVRTMAGSYCQMLWMRFLGGRILYPAGQAEAEPLRGGLRSFHPPSLRSQIGREAGPSGSVPGLPPIWLRLGGDEIETSSPKATPLGLSCGL